MPAYTPEECDILIAQAVRAKDLEAAVALYEPNAVFVLGTGESVTGHVAIREALIPFMSLETFDFTTETKAFLNAEQDIALVRGTWAATAKGPDGQLVEMAGKNLEVVRRQADGTWLYMIDHPQGADYP